MYLTQINDKIYNKIRGRNNKTLSNLTSFIRVFSGANKGLIIESNPNWPLFGAAGVLQNAISSVYGTHSAGSGTVGVTWENKYPIQATTGAPAKPRPVITLFNVKEGQDQISKEANLNITAFSIEQLELIQQYFMEPGYSLFVEWGWNTPEGVSGLIKSDSVAGIRNEVGDRALTDEALYKKRVESRGDYDCFFGFITGGEVTSEGNLFNVNIQMRGVPSLPAFLQSHHSIYKYDKTSNPLNSSTFPLYSESQLADGSVFTGKSNDEDIYPVKEKRFKNMFNNLPPIKQTKEVSELITTCKWYDFIGFDLDVIKKLEDEFQVSFLEKTGYFFRVIDNPNETKAGEFGIPIEKFLSNERYIRFGIAIDILNANAKTVKYTVGNKDLKSYIDIKDTKIGAFPFIFSTKKENLLIPGKLPDFTKVLTTVGPVEYSSLTNEGIDLRIPKAGGNGYISFVQEGNIGFPTKGSDNKPIPAAENTFKEISEHYGLLENLYINFEFFKNTITGANKNIREILMDLLNGMSSAVNSFWNFQIIEKAGDDGLLCIKIFDEHWAGQQKEIPKLFHHQGMDSVFLEASLNMKIPAEMMGQIINRRFSIASQPEQAIVNVDKDRKPDTFFAKGPDLFLDVRIENQTEISQYVAAPKKDPNKEWQFSPDKVLEDINTNANAVAAQNKKEVEIKTNEAESLGLRKSKPIQPIVGRAYFEYYDTNGKPVATSIPNASGVLQYSGKEAEKAKEYDNKTNTADVSQELDKRKNDREAAFNKNLDKMDFLVKPNKSAEFAIDKTQAFAAVKGDAASFGIYCYNDPIYFDKLKNNSFESYFKKASSSGLLSPLLPITYKFKILGCSGIRRWDSFVVQGIPKKYISNGIWQITEVEHNLSGMQWVTEVTANYRQQQ